MPKKARLAKGRPASWRSLADQYPPPRTRTDGHACARCGPLYLSLSSPFPFRSRFSTLLVFAVSRPTSSPGLPHPPPLCVSVCPALLHLSAASRSFAPPLDVPLVFPDSSHLRLPSLASLPLPATPSSSFPCYLFVFRALSIFLPLLSPPPPPPDFASPSYLRLLSFFRSPPPPPLPTSSLLTLFPTPRPLYLFLPVPLSTYPRRLRRDGPIFSSRFLGFDIFYTFFLPPPTAAHAPLPPPSGILPRAIASSLSRLCLTYAYDLLPSRPSVYPPPFSSSRVRLPLAPAFSFSSSALSFFPTSAHHPECSYLFDFFFTTTRPPTDAARRRPFSIGTLFSTIGSATYSRIREHAYGLNTHRHTRARIYTQTYAPHGKRERERRRDKEGRKKGAGIWGGNGESWGGGAREKSGGWVV